MAEPAAVDVRMDGPGGETALHMACLYAHTECVRLLLSYGADPVLQACGTYRGLTTYAELAQRGSWGKPGVWGAKPDARRQIVTLLLQQQQAASSRQRQREDNNVVRVVETTGVDLRPSRAPAALASGFRTSSIVGQTAAGAEPSPAAEAPPPREWDQGMPEVVWHEERLGRWHCVSYSFAQQDAVTTVKMDEPFDLSLCTYVSQ